MASSNSLLWAWYRENPHTAFTEPAGQPDTLKRLLPNVFKNAYPEGTAEYMIENDPFYVLPHLKLNLMGDINSGGPFFLVEDDVTRKRYSVHRARAGGIVDNVYSSPRKPPVSLNPKLAPWLSSSLWIDECPHFKGSVSFSGPIAVGKSTFAERVIKFDGNYHKTAELSYMIEIYESEKDQILFVGDFNLYIERFLLMDRSTPTTDFSFHANIMYRDVLKALYKHFCTTSKPFIIVFDRFFQENCLFYVLYSFMAKNTTAPDAKFTGSIGLFWPANETLSCFWKLYPLVTFLCVRSFDMTHNNQMITEGVRERGRVFEENIRPELALNFYRAFIGCADLSERGGNIVVVKSFDADDALLKVMQATLMRMFVCELKRTPKPFVTSISGFRLWWLTQGAVGDRDKCPEDWLAHIKD